jgi:clostripain
MSLALLPLAAALAQGPLPAPEVAPERPWTLMVYGAADNDADGPILHFLDDVRKALDDDPGMELLLFIDRSEGFSSDATVLGADFTGARVYRLRSDSAELLDASEHFPGMGADEEYEVDSADPRNIGAFVAFGKERFPARNYGLMIYSHADGCTMCPDEESGRDMNIPELTDRVAEDASVDFLALELCNMGGLEIAYEWRPGNGGFSADVLVAIPNAGPPLDWDRAFRRIRSAGHETDAAGRVFDPATLTALQFGELVVEEGHAGRVALAERNPDEAHRIGHEAAACYDLTKAAAVKRALDAFAVEASLCDAREVLEELRGSGEFAAMNYVRGRFGERPYVDATALLDLARECEDLSEAARAAAGEARAAVDALVTASFGMPGYEGFVQGENGIFLVFPDAQAWPNLHWYTPLAAREDGAPYGRWSFLKDGATPGNGVVENWFELLDSWYDDTSGDPAGSNGYAW